MLFRTFLLSLVALAPIQSAVAAAPEFVIQDPVPPQPRYETASTRVYTPENEQWFHDLIELNPGCTVVVVGQGISVSKTGGLTLPPGDVPADVTLSN